MSSRALNDDEVISEMNKMVLPILISKCALLLHCIVGRLHQARSDGESPRNKSESR